VKGGSNQLLSADATAALLDISVDTLYRNWKAWEMIAYRIGSRLKFRERDVNSFLERHRA